jgi:dTDP-4-dehydrorhamnose 3,5-epimerase
MIFTETKLDGAFVIAPEPKEDERGFFLRTWSQQEFREHGLNPRIVECSSCFNRKRGTVRGMHFQIEPYQEVKLVRCTAGAIYDVIVDLRPGSPTFRQWVGVEMTARNRWMIYIPEGFAQGFQSLEDDTEVFYQISETYHPEAARGLRWDDPAFAIQWPLPVTVTSIRDRQFALL